MKKTIAATLVFFSLIGTAQAGTVTAVGAVTALTLASQLKGIVGTATFDEGVDLVDIPLNQYAAQGMTFKTGLLTSMLAGVTQAGTASNPTYRNFAFTLPILNGGTYNGLVGRYAGAATFSINITQFGLTASQNGNQYLTVWNKQGAMIGQVNWVPGATASFLGVDTMGVPIGLITYGNDDVWNGQAYGIGGSTIYSDTWIWATGCTSNAQCDDGNPCTNNICNVATGACSFPNNAAVCNDGNACTQTDTCQNGVCVGGNVVVCQPLDGCHVAGVCNAANGQCTNPNKADGSACTDNNPCTQSDVCTAGACGGMAVACQPLDGCHVAGACNPMTGQCTNPLKPDGSACSDNNGCTQTDMCQTGVCVGNMPVMCPPADACHNAGVCNIATGMCDNNPKPDGTACDDGNGCTQTDTCQNGMCVGDNPVACPAPDGCHDAPLCNPMTGVCSNPVKADGSPCDDNNPCSQTDACAAGICVGGNPVTCAAKDSCHTAGLCNPANGACSEPTKADGSSCDDGNLCTQIDSCMAGVCTGSAAVTCSAKDGCHDVGTCDPATGMCNDPFKDGAACDDQKECTSMDACLMGTCGGTPKANGTPCVGGTCENGQCTPSGAGGGGMGGGGTGGDGTGTGTTSGTGTGTTTGTGGGGGGGTEVGGCGCGVASSTEGGAAWAALALILAARRRRRSA